jgi:hypothetical protein
MGRPFPTFEFAINPEPVGPFGQTSFDNGQLGGSELHCNVKPIEDSAARKSATVYRLGKFAGPIADNGHTLVVPDALLCQKMIQSR